MIKLYKTSCYSIGIFAFIHIGMVSAQSLPPFSDNNERYKPIIISTFLDEVNSNNGTLKVRRLGADSATAISQRAGNLLLSPIITYARGSMYTQSPYVGYNNPSSNTLGAMVTVEGWGKRSALTQGHLLLIPNGQQASPAAAANQPPYFHKKADMTA